jgi:hypothetical protein
LGSFLLKLQRTLHQQTEEFPMNDERSQQASPTRLSSSGSGSGGSQAGLLPLQLKPEIFREWFSAAFGFDVMQFSDLQDFPPRRILEMIVEDSHGGKERAAQIVHQMIGTDLELVMKRFDAARYGEDISAYIEGSPERSKKFFETIGGVDFFQEKMSPREIYERVMANGWMFKDNPSHRGFAAQGCDILVKHQAFGNVPSGNVLGEEVQSIIPTLRAIVKAIGYDLFWDDVVPGPLRIRMANAIKAGCRKFPQSSQYIEQYMFEEQLGGVPFHELAMRSKIPLDKLGNPFAVYVSRCGLLENTADKESIMPAAPADHDPRTGTFVPRPPGLPPPPPFPLPPKPTST